MEIVFFNGFTANPASFREFDARNTILFQIKVFGRKLKVATLTRSFIKVNARPSLRDKLSPLNIKMKNMLKRLICIFFWFRPLCLSKIKDQNMNQTESKYSWKRALRCYKRAPWQHLDNPEGSVKVNKVEVEVYQIKNQINSHVS